MKKEVTGRCGRKKIFCILHQILLGWSHKGELDGQDIKYIYIYIEMKSVYIFGKTGVKLSCITS